MARPLSALTATAPGEAQGVARQLARARRNSSSVIGYAQDGWDTYQRLTTWYKRRRRWTVTVDSKDRLYDSVLRWFLQSDTDTEPPRAVRAVESGRRGRFMDDYEDSRASAPQVDIFYDERGSREIDIQGHKVNVSIQKPEQMVQEAGAGFRSVEPDRIYFHALSYEGQQAVIALLRSIANSTATRKPALHLMTQWGDWQRRDDLPPRTLDSVVLKAGQMERLRDDLQGFLDDEAEYARRGMPYHRGYMLHGPPGTGKTSIVRALAAHFELDLWYAPLGDLTKDTSLISLINQVRAGSILLLEDVDVFHAARQRDDEEGGLSMAGLLNALDGVATPHGLITFMTTNDKSVLDEAVIRPGRIDRQEEIGLPDKDQIARLFNSWYDTELDLTEVNSITFDGSTAAVTEVFKRNLNDAGAALLALQNNEQVTDDPSVTTPKGIRYDRERPEQAKHARQRAAIRAAGIDL